MSQSEHDDDRITLDPAAVGFGDGDEVGELGVTHFIGIGGAGMSVLAEMLVARGLTVTGSDAQESRKTQRLRDLGVTVWIGQDPGHVRGAHTVVYSSAIKPENPEIRAARRLGIHLVHRSDILSLLMHNRHSVTVAGAHGKTTTSALLAHILAKAGTGALADPSYAVGGSIRMDGGGVADGGHAGSGEVFVAEADESDGSFEKYRPDIAIITHAEADHLDHYGTRERYRSAFVTYAAHARRLVLVGIDDPNALEIVRSLDTATASRVLAYSTGRREDVGDLNGSRFVPIRSETEDPGTGEERFVIDVPASLTGGSQDRAVAVRLAIPGIHNARNATAAILAATALGMDPDVASRAAATFRGAVGRFQILGMCKQVTVIADYAHHPTEITALLEAARRRYPRRTLRVLFQPHLFSRTRFFTRQFAQALALADDVLVTGIFPARERQEDFPGAGPESIVNAAAEVTPARTRGWITAVGDMQLATRMMAMRAHHGDVVFVVGAGDISTMGPVLLHALEAHRDGCED